MSAEQKQIPGGMVIFFEGIDGVGKTTQLELAAKALQAEGWAVETTRSHGGTEIGEALREVSLSSAARPVETDFHISLAIHEALAVKVDGCREENRIILIDRGPISMAAYQMYGDGFDMKQGWSAVERDLAIFSPELNIIYTATTSIALDRARKRSGAKANYFESKPPGFFDAAQQGFMDSAERFGATIIDAEQPIGQVHAQTMKAIQAVVAKKRAN
ncbi:MAG TPA: dTMP kinase [Candidatus Saccharimonadales bacterium]|nr:dTMP kinase [Candidatus Saccharimonadales bacterium]